MSGALYVVATPIGHLDDITLRALDVLRSVDVVYCEDTRHTKRLFERHRITTRAKAFHQHSEDKILNAIVAGLREGQTAALVTDAGTPCISDPGSRLVNACREADISVQVVPGPDAVTAALSVSGLGFSGYTFLGFIPHKKGRETMFTGILEQPALYVAYESPHRVLKTLKWFSEKAPECPLVIARELTKIHEEVVRGMARDLYDEFMSRDALRGEFVLLIDSRKL